MEQYNQRSPAVKRLMREAQELRESTEDYHAQPLEDNLFEWHFTVRGPPDTEFEGGIFHGRFLLPSQYPMKPPNIIIMTPNGRFETNKKICLSISGHHPETWQPSWSLRTALLALIGFMPSDGQGAIGSLDCPVDERRKMARRSQSFECPQCGQTKHLLKEAVSSSPKQENPEKAEDFASQVNSSSVKTELEEGQFMEAETPVTEEETLPPEIGELVEEVQIVEEPVIRQRSPLEQSRNPRNIPVQAVHHAVTNETLQCDFRSVISFVIFLCGACFLTLGIRRVYFLQ